MDDLVDRSPNLLDRVLLISFFQRSVGSRIATTAASKGAARKRLASDGGREPALGILWDSGLAVEIAI